MAILYKFNFFDIIRKEDFWRKIELDIDIENTKTSELMIVTTMEQIKSKKKIGYSIIKKMIDILIGIFGSILLLPITLIVYITQKLLKDKGPIFYIHTRIGKNGKSFKMYKFRTMIVDADKQLEQYLSENQEAKIEFEKNYKLKKDPRITKLGKFLRKTNIDEIPQFINILKNDMSLIGPRPIVDKEISKFGNKMQIIHSVKPGITGYWAANRTNNTTYNQRVDMEVFYAQNYGLKLDIQIFIKTIRLILKK